MTPRQDELQKSQRALFSYSSMTTTPARWEQGGRQWSSPGGGFWDSSQNLLYIFSPGLQYPLPQHHHCPTLELAVVATQACQCKLAITTLRKPNQPIATGAGLPREKSLLVDPLTEGLWKTLMDRHLLEDRRVCGAGLTSHA